MAMHSDHLAKLQAGRVQARQTAKERSIRRVEAFYAWMVAGSVMRDIPQVPTDSDFSAWRETK